MGGERGRDGGKTQVRKTLTAIVILPVPRGIARDVLLPLIVVVLVVGTVAVEHLFEELPELGKDEGREQEWGQEENNLCSAHFGWCCCCGY